MLRTCGKPYRTWKRFISVTSDRFDRIEWNKLPPRRNFELRADVDRDLGDNFAVVVALVFSTLRNELREGTNA